MKSSIIEKENANNIQIKQNEEIKSFYENELNELKLETERIKVEYIEKIKELEISFNERLKENETKLNINEINSKLESEKLLECKISELQEQSNSKLNKVTLENKELKDTIERKIKEITSMNETMETKSKKLKEQNVKSESEYKTLIEKQKEEFSQQIN